MSAEYRKKCEERSKEFYDAKVSHHRYAGILKKAIFYLTQSHGTCLVSIVGPSGVGKSRLVTDIREAILKQAADDMDADLAMVPFLYTEANAYGYKRFAYTYLFSAALSSIGDPFARLSSTHRGEAEKPNFASLKRRSKDDTEIVLRERLKDELALRSTWVWCIDEAQHTLQAKSGPSENQLDVLKSMAQSGKAKLCLIGPPVLRDKLLCSGQLARRSVTLCFTRYRIESEEDVTHFAVAAEKLFKLMRFASTPAVEDHLDMLYAGSLGCIGVLKEWLQRSMAHAMARYSNLDEVHLTIDDLREGEADEPTKSTLLDEIERMERAEVALSRDDFLDRIIPPSRSGKRQKSEDLDVDSRSISRLTDLTDLSKADIASLQRLLDAGVLKVPRKAGRSKPGERRPGRDPSGTGHGENVR